MKVLISRPDKIGDVTLSLHGAKQLKKLRPEIEIYMHVAKYTQELVKNIKFIDGVITLDEEIEKNKFDAVVDLMAKYRTAKRYLNPLIKIRIGNSARLHSIFYNKTRYIRRSKALINEAEYNWQLMSLIDDKLKHSNLTQCLSKEDFKEILPYDEFKDFTVLMPGVTVSAMGWSIESWIELSKILAEQTKKQVIFLLGPAEKDLEEKILLEISDIENIDLRKFEDFKALLGFLDAAKYYVGTSTGITHLASALNCEGVALYPEKKSMHPRRWQPFHSKLKIASLSKTPTPADIAEGVTGKLKENLNPLSREKLTVFVICCDEERNIERALESIKWCDEILIVDSGSKDKTLEIAGKYTDKILHRDWTGNRDQKQFALDNSKNKWVLNIDADEEISMHLRGEIENILSKPKRVKKGYNLCRLIYFLGRWWDKGGWYPEYRLRFFQKQYVSWGGKDPHEKAILKGRTGKLPGFIYHYTYKDIAHQVSSLQKHAQMMADSLYKDGKKTRFFNLFLNPLFRFFKFYILKKGFLEGISGVLVGIQEGYYTFLKYLLLWEKQKGKK